MLILGLPVMDGHELTQKCVNYIASSVSEPEHVGILVIDNASEEPYTTTEFAYRNLSVVRLSRNQGYYRPLDIVRSAATEADIVALMHNDVFVYERGWDARLRVAFVNKSDLGMVGFFGSDEVDDRGGRGGGSMSNFAGTLGTPAEAHGYRVTDLRPALVLDSLFMAVRVACVPLLRIDAHTPICHFMDKVWPLRLIKAGWKVGVLGISIDHLGGQTAVAMPRFEEEAKQWCLEEGIEPASGMGLYLESERRFLTEMRPSIIPSHMMGWEHARG